VSRSKICSGNIYDSLESHGSTFNDFLIFARRVAKVKIICIYIYIADIANIANLSSINLP